MERERIQSLSYNNDNTVAIIIYMQKDFEYL